MFDPPVSEPNKCGCLKANVSAFSGVFGCVTPRVVSHVQNEQIVSKKRLGNKKIIK